MSGTTCVFCLYSRGLLHSANVGDSRAVLCTHKEDAGRSAFQLNVDVRGLTRDHKPDDVEEKLRVEASGGEVRDNRVYMQTFPYIGLNLSRSFGDSLAHKVGVTHEADVSVSF